MSYFNQLEQKFERIGWVLEKSNDSECKYSLWSNEHAPGQEWLENTLGDVLGCYDQAREMAGFDFEELGFKKNDGGRAAAGFKGGANDCVTRAIAIATGKPYQEVYDALGVQQKEFLATTRSKKYKKNKPSARNGVYRKVYQAYLESLGWEWKPTMEIGSGCQVHMRKDELPGGAVICRLSGHLATVVDHVVQDTHNPCRDGFRCVYGYFHKP